MQKFNFIPALAISMICVSLCGCGTSGTRPESVVNDASESTAASADMIFSYDLVDSSFSDVDKINFGAKKYSKNGNIVLKDDAGKEYRATYKSKVPLKQDSNTSLVSKTSRTMVYFDVDSTHAENSMELFQEMAKDNVQSDSSHVSIKEGKTDDGISYFMERTVNDDATVNTYKFYMMDKTGRENPVLYEVTFDAYGKNKDSVESSDKDAEDFAKSLVFHPQ